MPGGVIKVVKAISGRYLSGNGGRVVRLFGLFAADFIDHWSRRPMGNPFIFIPSKRDLQSTFFVL